MKYVSDLEEVVRAELASLLRALESTIGHCGPIWQLFSNLTAVGQTEKLIYQEISQTSNHSDS